MSHIPKKTAGLSKSTAVSAGGGAGSITITDAEYEKYPVWRLAVVGDKTYIVPDVAGGSETADAQQWHLHSSESKDDFEFRGDERRLALYNPGTEDSLVTLTPNT